MFPRLAQPLCLKRVLSHYNVEQEAFQLKT